MPVEAFKLIQPSTKHHLQGTNKLALLGDLNTRIRKDNQLEENIMEK